MNMNPQAVILVAAIIAVSQLTLDSKLRAGEWQNCVSKVACPDKPRTIVVEKKTIIYVQPEPPKTAEQIKQENYTRSQGSYQGAPCVGC
jgi:hypothetical protein